MASHPIVHLEIPATNPATASKFYHDVFGWKIEHDPTFNYYQFVAEGGPGGGYLEAPAQGKIGEIVVYIGTDDIEASLAAIERAGGKTTMQKTEIPGIGWFAQFTDPQGNRLALFKENKPS